MPDHDGKPTSASAPRPSRPERAAAEIEAWHAAMTRAHGDVDYVLTAPHSNTRLSGASVQGLLTERRALLEELLRVRVQSALDTAHVTLEQIAERHAIDPQRLHDALAGTRGFSPLLIARIADETGIDVMELLRGAEPAAERARICACGTHDPDLVTVLPAAAFDALLEEKPPIPNEPTQRAFARLRETVRRPDGDAPVEAADTRETGQAGR